MTLFPTCRRCGHRVVPRCGCGARVRFEQNAETRFDAFPTCTLDESHAQEGVHVRCLCPFARTAAGARAERGRKG